jgi:hypothetical protein
MFVLGTEKLRLHRICEVGTVVISRAYIGHVCNYAAKQERKGDMILSFVPVMMRNEYTSPEKKKKPM